MLYNPSLKAANSHSFSKTGTVERKTANVCMALQAINTFNISMNFLSIFYIDISLKIRYWDTRAISSKVNVLLHIIIEHFLMSDSLTKYLLLMKVLGRNAVPYFL